eukprot:COSAG02_NODE_231_length_27944_cov_5.843347_3_plen_78_part_00
MSWLGGVLGEVVGRCSNMRLWEPWSPVRRVAALLGGVIGVNDAVIGLARDFPAPEATMLAVYKDEEVAASANCRIQE